MGQRVMKVETLLKTLQTAGCERVDVVQTGASWDIGFRGGASTKNSGKMFPLLRKRARDYCTEVDPEIFPTNLINFVQGDNGSLGPRP